VSPCHKAVLTLLLFKQLQLAKHIHTSDEQTDCAAHTVAHMLLQLLQLSCLTGLHSLTLFNMRAEAFTHACR